MRMQLRYLVMAALVVLAPHATAAQNSTAGTITGVVRDSSGGVLPGVTVEAASPALIEKVRVATTDSDGRFRIIDLRPGVYSVTFTLAGFRAVRREGIELTTGFTATVNSDLPVGAVEETITVTGAAPVVDVQGVQQQEVFSGETVRALPIGKNSGIYTVLIPAATQGNLSNTDVGGTKGESTQNFAVHGGRSDDSFQLRDGLYFGSHLGVGGNYNSSINPAVVQEVNVQLTGGLTAEAQSGGVQINVVSRDGGNQFHGVVNADWTNADLQGTNISDAIRRRGATNPGDLRKLYDIAAGFGGPIKQDKLWFYSSARRWEASSFIPGNYYNGSANPLFYEPDISRPAYDRNLAQEGSFRVTWQASEKHKFSGTTRWEYNCNCNFNIANGQFAPEAAGSNWYVPMRSNYVNWTYPATNRLLVQVGAIELGGQHQRRLAEEVTTNAVSIFDRTRNYWYGATDRTLVGFTQNLAITDYGQANVTGTVSYVTGSHNFKVGGLFLQSYRDLYQAFPEAIGYTFAGTVPELVHYYASPLNAKMRTRQTALFAQEQWTLSRLTAYLGLRYEGQFGWNPAIDLPGGRFVPARHFDEVRGVPDWKDINPRVGFAYDLFGTGRTAVKGYVGRFVDYEANGGVVFSSHPANTVVTTATRVWTDNGDYVPQENELGPLSNVNFGRSIAPTTTFADEVLHGWGNRNYNWQGSISFQHELATGLGINVGYYRTSFGNFQVTDNVLVGPEDFDQFCITAPANSRLPGGGGERICGLLDIKQAKFGQVQNLVRLDSSYGGQSEVFDGVDLTFNARFPAGMLTGGVSTGRAVTDACAVVEQVPELAMTLAATVPLTTNHSNGPTHAPSRFCRIEEPWSARTQFKLSGTYTLPWDLRGSFNYQFLPGIYTHATYVIPGADIAAGLGRAPAAGARATARVELIEPTQLRREDPMSLLNVAVSRVISVGGARVQPRLELHNVLNANTVHTTVQTYGPAWEQVRGVLAPRLIKLAAQIDF